MKKIFVSMITLITLLISPIYCANAKVIQDSESQTLYKEQSEVVTVFNNKGNNFYITKDDINLMAQIVYAESCAEPYEGKVAVASVILNRLKDSHFPNNIEGVVKQKCAFSCVRDGKIDAVPNEHCFNAVMDALRGKDPTNNAVFFYNPTIATSTWMKNINKKNVKKIGNHVFFIVQ
ncbi:cell wall hydrolase [Clostridium massiliodielmoense]|uniref:cell wall hydrolase n=1 Tax=Clostridium massiliodielmoense TaxID=1776385 RepID=UPI000A268C35|nr:cell wall hydrolase [Clostridium massiliodielmoense]